MYVCIHIGRRRLARAAVDHRSRRAASVYVWLLFTAGHPLFTAGSPLFIAGPPLFSRGLRCAQLGLCCLQRSLRGCKSLFTAEPLRCSHPPRLETSEWNHSVTRESRLRENR